LPVTVIPSSNFVVDLVGAVLTAALVVAVAVTGLLLQ
jgi:hypothetical protein